MAERVRVRDITNNEGNRLLRIVRRGSGSVVKWRRAQIVLWSAQGMEVPQIACEFRRSTQYRADWRTSMSSIRRCGGEGVHGVREGADLG
jgi:hypothetical protein